MSSLIKTQFSEYYTLLCYQPEHHFNQFFSAITREIRNFLSWPAAQNREVSRCLQFLICTCKYSQGFSSMSANETETVLYQLWHCCGPLYTRAVGTLKGRCGWRAENLHRINYIYLFVCVSDSAQLLSCTRVGCKVIYICSPWAGGTWLQTIHIHSIRTTSATQQQQQDFRPLKHNNNSQIS